jgi:hypothetical protein
MATLTAEQVTSGPYKHTGQWCVQVSVRENGDDVRSAQKEARADLIHKFGGHVGHNSIRTKTTNPDVRELYISLIGLRARSAGGIYPYTVRRSLLCQSGARNAKRKRPLIPKSRSAYAHMWKGPVRNLEGPTYTSGC